MKLTYSQFFFWAAILAVDLLVFVILGLLLMAMLMVFIWAFGCLLS